MFEDFISAQGVWFAYLVLLTAAVVLTYTGKRLISYLSRAAFNLGISVFALSIGVVGWTLSHCPESVHD